MKKVIGILLLLAIIVSVGYTYGGFTKSYATLSENKTIAKALDDFILHVRVNDNEDGIEVKHSIQYTGKDNVEIKHQTPLISVSLLNDQHDFTGSYVIKSMEGGDIYHSQEADILSLPYENESDLYIKARFYVNDEMKSIEHVEELKFE
ncbi:hypothetical protein ACDX78_00875 [Virgibacillus oceani]